MKIFSQYNYVFPDFKKYLNHDDANSCIENVYQDKGIKFVFKFYRKYSYIGSSMGELIFSLFDAAMKMLHDKADKLKKKDKHKYKEYKKFRKEYKQEKKFQEDIRQMEEDIRRAQQKVQEEFNNFFRAFFGNNAQNNDQPRPDSQANASSTFRPNTAPRKDRQKSLQVPDELQTLATYKDSKDFQGLLSMYTKLDKKLLKVKDPAEITKEEAEEYLKTAFNVTTLQEIRSHYKKLSLIMHPDKTGNLQLASRTFLDELYKFTSHYYSVATA